MAYSADTFTSLEQPTLAKWNKLWSNDAAFDLQTLSGLGSSSSTIGWQLLKQTTLAGAADTISAASFTARRYLHVVISAFATGGTIDATMTFNSDAGANYAFRYEENGGAESANASTSNINLTATSAQQCVITLDITNFISQEKAVVGQTNLMNSAGAAAVPTRRSYTAKWISTAAQITTLAVSNGGTGDYAIGSSISVWGRD